MGRVDTTRAVVDEVAVLDSLQALPRDSSARLAHFHHVRRDRPQVDAMQRKTHPLYLPTPAAIRSVHKLDSLRWTYRVRQVVAERDIRVPVDLTLEAYIALRQQSAIRRNWEALAQAYKMKDEKPKGLSDLFGEVTTVEIPIPKNPLFSIFGPERIRLNINGAVDIRAGYRNTKSDLFTNNPLARDRSEPDFGQEVQMNVRGEIGDKLRIDADWNTGRQFDFENQVKIRYAGYEDDIVQTVEAGNVSLGTKSTFISSNQALFGVKAGFQFGPLTLTTIASQKKGQIRTFDVSGGSQSQPFDRRATDYVRDQHFFVDTLYIPLFDDYYSNIPPKADLRHQIRDIEVWVSRIGNEDPNERDVVAFIEQGRVLQYQNDLASRNADFVGVPGRVEVGRFIRLEPADYTYHEYAGYITLNRAVQHEQAIAVAYSVPDPANPSRTIDIGNFGAKDTLKNLKLVMKLVRPQKLGPQFRTAWKQMLKNIYSLGGRGIKEEGFELNIYYEVPGRPPPGDDNIVGFNLIQVFGLDRFGEQPGSPPDNKFDYYPGYTINEARGELIFPTVEPFRKRIRDFFEERGRTIAEADSFIFGEVYDTTLNGAVNSQRNRFAIKGKSTTSIASTYNLGFGNLVEGSVQVIVDGQPATPNVDYTVDYITGQLVIRNPGLLVPGRNLQIKYEANDLFQLASKALLGARGDLALSKTTSLGFTIMNLNQQTLSDKVRINEEPISNTILGFDGGTSLDLGFLTDGLNYLPGIQTTAPSSFSMRGEAAYMLPDPNTRKSSIPQDEGGGIAYIDDFEGVRRTVYLGTNFGTWKESSVPFYLESLDDYRPLDKSISTSDPVTLSQILPDTSKMEYKGRLVWYNIFPSDVLVQDLRPEKVVRRGDEQVTVMNLWFRPRERGAFNYSMDLENKLFASPTKAWGGVMRLLGTTSTNLLDENINFIEFWIRIERSQPAAKMLINLGLISEDVIPNRQLDTEDGLDGGLRNGILGPGEDVGLDGLTAEQERIRYGAFIAKYPQFANDPSGDNWLQPVLSSVNRQDYAGVNGTEGNSRSETGRFPDTEDLNRNNVLDRTNSYFEYELPLDTTNAVFQQYWAGGGANGWYQIRIPLNEYVRQIGDPTFTTVEAIRVLLAGAQDEVLIRMADFNLIGNNWEELVKNDSTFRVSMVSVEDNPGIYTPPPGVERARDRTRPDENILLNEQSLALLITGLRDGESRQANKRYARPLDLFNYRTMKMFVHGENRPGRELRYTNEDDYDAEVFFRFGSDSLNYYEYRAPVRPGWDPLNEMVILFEEITAIKLGRDSAQTFTDPVPVPNGPPGATYRVRGNPTLTNVRLLVIGVENPLGKGRGVIDGEIWANELRLTSVDDTPGWAYRFDTSLKFADVASVSFVLTQRDPHFHSLEDRFGSRNSDRNWNLSANIGLEKFLPRSWQGTTLGFSYSHVEALQNPKYLPGTDISVNEAANRTAEIERTREEATLTPEDAAAAVRTQSQTLVVSETYAMPNLRIVVPSESWFITKTINSMTFGYSYNTTRRRNPTILSFDQWGWNARMGYALQLGDNFLEPMADIGEFFLFSPWKGLKWYYTPRTFNLSTQLNRAQTREHARNQAEPKPTVRNFTATRNANFSWTFWEGGYLNPATDYNLDLQSTLVNMETDHLGRQRSFSEILTDIFTGDKLVDLGTITNYSQSISFNPRLVVPPVLDLDKVFSATARYTSRYDWQNNIQAGDLGKSAQWTSDINTSLDINLKQIANQIWSAPPSTPAPTTDTTEAATSFSLLNQLDQISRWLVKAPIFDFDRISLTYSQQNRSQNSGVLGRPGFLNVWGRVPFFQESLPEYGPSLLYQLGLSTDPHGDMTVKGKGSFPFFTSTTTPGLRAPNGNLTNVFSQGNRMSMRTSRPLWEGARLELSWNLNWDYNANSTIQSDSLGNARVLNRLVSGSLERSFITMPPILAFKFFKTGIEEVNKRFEELKADRSDTRLNDAKLAQAFEDGLEALPLSKKLISEIMPRPNWSIRWDGLEKFSLFKSFAQRLSLEHNYTSSYRRRWKLSPAGDEAIESQQVSYGFAPLVGMNVTFVEVFKGSLGGTVRYGTTTTYDLVPSAQNIVESQATDIAVSANYGRRGFEFPFFGLSLSNDLDFSFSYGYSRTVRRVYDMKANFKKDGTALEGSSRTIIESRIKYVLSARVTASLFHKYTQLKPDEGGSRIPGQTVNDVGLDIRLAIQP
jgi:cell surface protein SprA